MYCFKSRLVAIKCKNRLLASVFLFILLSFFSQRREWWLLDRLAQALMLSVFLLLDWGVKPLWPVMGLPMLLWVCDLGFVSLKREMRYMYGHSLYFTVSFSIRS